MEELELITTSDLIKELFRRETFTGILIFSKDDHKINFQKHEFNVATTTDYATSIQILQEVINNLESQIES